MSFWIYKEDKTGRRHWWLIDVEPMLIIMAIGLLVALIGPRFILNPNIMNIVPFVFVIIGLILVITSKLSLFHQGVRVSFGTGLMSQGYARLYKFAYILIGIGVLLLLYRAISTA